nr:MAG TPA: homing endonuclease [Bacteriophage sp.]
MVDEKVIFNKRFRPIGIRNYWVSEFGDIINLDNKPCKIMRQTITKDNHCRIELKISPNKGKKFYVHVLVYKAFVGELIDGMVVEHLDSNGLNNYYKNLKQSTQKENIHTAIDFGTFGNNSKKTIVLLDMKENKVLEFEQIKLAAKYIGLPQSVDCVNKLFRRKSTRDRFKLVACGYLV